MKELTRVLFVVGLFFAVTPLYAATLYMDPHETDIHPGDTIAVGVRIDTEDGECINVVDGVIEYPENIIPVDISTGNSILPVWVQEPSIDSANNRITFAGGIPNGYCGRIEGDPRLTNMILEVIFQAPGLRVGTGSQDPLAQITFSDDTTVFLNDGRGTKADLRALGSSIFVFEKPGGTLVDDWNSRIAEDEASPNAFSVSLNTDPSIYAGRYFIVFNTTDKQSGIDHYEVIEEPLDSFSLFNWGGVDAPWVTARSPYLLQDQSLNSIIRVKAVDKAGNEYIATYVPDESVRGFTERTLVSVALGVAGAVVLIALGVLYFIYRRRNIGAVDVDDTFEADDISSNN